MGTNYYLHTRPPCESCGRRYDDEALHIGKSSAGWCFALHVIPKYELNDLGDWARLWNKPGMLIVDEYGDTVSPDVMMNVITDRGTSDSRWNSDKWRQSYSSEEDFHRRNNSQRGPNGLLRHRIDGSCIAHGTGTWDCIKGEFS